MAFGTSIAGLFSGSAGGGFVGGSAVRLFLDAANFNAGLKTSEARLHGFGRRVSSVGRGMSRFGTVMTRNVTLPVVAAGAAAVKFAVDFETAFTKIRANSNLTNKEISQLRKVVLDLGGKTGKTPLELAEGLYFLASAGLNARQVQETLTMAAKASAAGFGEVADIARLTATALNAYAKDGLTAKEVTDTLAAAIREGSAEPDEFAHAIGRIMPIAQKAGVGFDSVTASLASLSNIGLDVNEGVTAMRGLLQALVAPGKMSREALNGVGLSAQMLLDSLAKDGLLSTLHLLDDAIKSNTDTEADYIKTLREIVPNVRSLTGLLGLTGQEADKVESAFRRVIGANGDLDRAFDKTKKSAGFKLQKLLADLQTLAIEVGTEALPVLKDVANAMSDVFKWFRSLDEGTRNTILKWGLIAAALGPVAKLLGTIVGLGGRAVSVLAGVGAGLFGKGAAGAAAGGAAATGARGGLAGGLFGLARAHPVATALTIVATTVILRAAHVAREDEKTRSSARQFIKERGVQEALDQGVATRQGNIIKDSEGRLTLGTIKALNETHREYFRTLSHGADAAKLYNRIAADTDRITEKQNKKLVMTVAAIKSLGGELSATEIRWARNLIAAGDFDAAMKILTGSLDEATGKGKGAGKGIDEVGTAIGRVEPRIGDFKGLIDSLDTDKRIRLTADTSQARGAISALHSQLINLARTTGLSVRVLEANVQGRASGGPVFGGNAYMVGERGPEMFRPSRSGWIVPNHQLGGDRHLTVNFYGPVDRVEPVKRGIREALDEHDRDNDRWQRVRRR